MLLIKELLFVRRSTLGVKTIWGIVLTAKDRSGRLEMVEEAHLGKLLKKIKTSPAKNQISTPDFTGEASTTLSTKGAPTL